MNQNLDLKKIKQKTSLLYHRDGLADLILGTLLILDGFFIFSDNIGMMGGMIFVMILVMSGLKNKLTFPRIGYAELPADAKGRKKLPLIIAQIVIIQLGVFFIYEFSYDHAPPEFNEQIAKHIPLIIGFVFVSLALLLAYTQKLRRVYGYTALVTACFVAGHFITLGLPYYLIIIGTVIAVTGMILLVKFVKKYPLPQKETHHG